MTDKKTERPTERPDDEPAPSHALPDEHMATFVEEGQLLSVVAAYLDPEGVAAVERVLDYARAARPALQPGAAQAVSLRDVDYATSVALTLAESLHIDAITLGAVLLYQMAESRTVTLGDVRTQLGGAFGKQVAATIASIERFDTLRRPASALRRHASSGEAEELGRERRRSRERQRQQDADALRKMFVSMAEDPRVVVIKIADQLRLMRAVVEASDLWRARASRADASTDTDGFVEPSWTLEECRLLALETREVFAPLAGRLGMSRVEGELEDLAFAVLEPEEYEWLRAAVEEATTGRRAYVERVTAILRREMEAIGIRAEISGRVKHLYSIYKKVVRTGGRDLSGLYDMLAFRILVDTVGECYLVLGHVHELWKPKDGRIKDFIASPKPNGYRSLHTTVFCLDGQLAEIQIRTFEMHQLAEYGVAMHWYYKDVGDAASANARSLQGWVQQVRDWQQELQRTTPVAPGAAVGDGQPLSTDVLKEHIYVFTPAGDAKELPAGATPLDFAYRVHTDLGNHVAGVRITTDDGNGKLTRKLVPLDYELKSGDVVELMKRGDAHPSRDWLRVVRTKLARDRIMRYLKEHERDIDAQVGRERLDRELRTLGLRKGFETLDDDDLHWLVKEFGYADELTLLAAIGLEKIRVPAVLLRVRERLKLPAPGEVETPEAQFTLAPQREEQSGASVEGMAGMLTHLANCCNPLPGDDLCGFITRGRGVVIHRADCPNLRHLLVRQPERGVQVAWPKLDGQQLFRAPIIVEGEDRTGLLRDVTGVITGHKINMLKVDVVTRARPDRAIISALLEIPRPEALETVLRDLRAVNGVILADRKQPYGSGRDAATGEGKKVHK